MYYIHFYKYPWENTLLNENLLRTVVLRWTMQVTLKSCSGWWLILVNINFKLNLKSCQHNCWFLTMVISCYEINCNFILSGNATVCEVTISGVDLGDHGAWTCAISDNLSLDTNKQVVEVGGVVSLSPNVGPVQLGEGDTALHSSSVIRQRFIFLTVL